MGSMSKKQPLLLIPVILLLLASCKKDPPDNTQRYFDAVFEKIDSSTTANKAIMQDADLKYLKASFAALLATSDAILAEKYYRIMDYYWHTKDNYDSTLLYADSIINLLKGKLDKKENAAIYIKTMFSKASVNIRAQNNNEALQYYITAKKMMSAGEKNPALLHRYYLGMISIFYSQENYLREIEFCRLMESNAAAAFKNPYEVFFTTQRAMRLIGECYVRTGQLDSAVFYLNGTLAYIDQNECRFPEKPPINFETMRIVVDALLGDVRMQQKDFASAERLFLKSHEVYQQFPEPVFKAYLRFSLVNIYLETNQLKKAHSMLALISASMDTAQIKARTAQYFKLCSDYYFKNKQLNAATRCLLKSNRYKDSLKVKDNAFLSTNLPADFEYDEQKQMNQLLAKDSQLKHSYLLLAAFSAIMAFVIFMLVWFSHWRRAGYVRQLKVLNNEALQQNDDLLKTLDALEQSLDENNRISRVVAHDLKNPISAIRTLVYSMSLKEKSGAGKESLELINQTCVESIALIKDLLDHKTTASDPSVNWQILAGWQNNALNY